MKAISLIALLLVAASATAAPVTGQITLIAQSGSGFGTVRPYDSPPSSAAPGSYSGTFVVDSALLSLANGSYSGSSYLSAFNIQIDSISFALASSSYVQNITVADHQIVGMNLSLASSQPVPNGSFPSLSISGGGNWSATISANAGYIANNVQGGVGGASYAVSAVPEAQTYAMMVAGLCLLGFIARRRQ